MNRLSKFFEAIQSTNPLAWLALTCLTCTATHAQSPPDAGRILQETQQLTQPQPQSTGVAPPITLPSSPRAVPPASTPAEARVNVTQFVFVGNEAISQDVLQSAVANYANRALNFGELMQAVEAVEARYKEAGYFLAQAYLPPQKIRDGAIEIVIAEGKLGEARLEG
ncbi:MAG: hypothetical protein K9K38_18350, partial [Rhodoferax sp.]|nr:hypothetical protein [Rhodoferax sp.]